MYAVVNSTTKKIKSAYCVVGGVTKKIKAIYGVVDGTTKLVWKSGGDIYSTKGIVDGTPYNYLTSMKIVTRNDINLTIGNSICQVTDDDLNIIGFSRGCVTRTYNYLAFLDSSIRKITLYKYNSSTKSYDAMNTVETGISSILDTYGNYDYEVFDYQASSPHISINDDKIIVAYHLLEKSNRKYHIFISRFNIIDDKIVYVSIDNIYNNYVVSGDVYVPENVYAPLNSSNDLNVISSSINVTTEDGTNATFDNIESIWAYISENGSYKAGICDSDWTYKEGERIDRTNFNYVTEDGKYLLIWDPGYSTTAISLYYNNGNNRLSYFHTITNIDLKYFNSIFYNPETEIIILQTSQYTTTASLKKMYHYQLSSSLGKATNLGTYLYSDRYSKIMDITFNGSNAAIIGAKTGSGLVSANGAYYGNYSKNNSGVITGYTLLSTLISNSPDLGTVEFINRY